MVVRITGVKFSCLCVPKEASKDEVTAHFDCPVFQYQTLRVLALPPRWLDLFRPLLWGLFCSRFPGWRRPLFLDMGLRLSLLSLLHVFLTSSRIRLWSLSHWLFLSLPLYCIPAALFFLMLHPP
ncbi:hypothetical protein HPB47_025267 [Ixodes persulcatus]|uniref:Uncharacterized protein n=1 Tax=Ixodes persulcatus TaxID=34615 RepID=A0AC60Q1Y2_IXOPE|nr:hypothetical protein HPB47_025267 [Ixodes persulcatus]